MDEQKFEISGEIEGGESNPKRRSITGRFILFLLLVLVIGSVWYFPFLQDEFPALKKITMGSNYVEVDTTLLNENFELKEKADSLQLLTDSLLTVNDILLQGGEQAPTGIYYEVQIGAFSNFDIEKYNSGLVELHGETTNGITKLTLGRFSNLKLAADFLKDVKEMGFKDAWVVAKENGERIPFDNEALNRDLP